MQTFLPYESFVESAKCLDNKRLNNQINEGLVILRTLSGWYTKEGKKGWPNHPAVKMWKGYELALAIYSVSCLNEYDKRTNNPTHKRFANIIDALKCLDSVSGDNPPWFGNPELHASHRAALLAKNPEWYDQFGWSEEPKIDYVWPVK